MSVYIYMHEMGVSVYIYMHEMGVSVYIYMHEMGTIVHNLCMRSAVALTYRFDLFQNGSIKDTIIPQQKLTLAAS